MQGPRMPEHLPKAIVFAAWGALLSLGAPVGLLLLRFLTADDGFHRDFVGVQIKSDPLLYSYLTFATMFMFVLLGYSLGSREDELATTSITDPLTRLRNRRHIYQRLEEELARSSRHHLPFALLLIDVDHLKDINDRGGHDAGDRALVCVGDTLRNTCRSTDLPARYGGDEFVVLLPSTSAGQALGLCERIRESLRHCSAGLPIPLTVSIGIAEPGETISSAEKLFAAADSALYVAKEAGRDRAVLADAREIEPPSHRSRGTAEEAQSSRLR
jgi:diguanylate cyclase (GGDEF)-like protein